MKRLLEAIRCEGKKARLLKFEGKLFPMIDHLRIRRDVSDDYFAEFYDILRFVDESPLIGNDFRQKYTYIAIAKSTLSEEQLSGLSCYLSNRPDVCHFKDLIEKYAVFSDFQPSPGPLGPPPTSPLGPPPSPLPRGGGEGRGRFDRRSNSLRQLKKALWLLREPQGFF